MTRLLAAVSHHGLGHLAQAAPVLNALHATRPDLEFLIWSGVPNAALAARVTAPFELRPEPADVGLAMHDAVRVDLARSRDAYLEFHQDWEARVAREADWLRVQRVDAVLADVACLPLAAAARAGLPGVALCSLNWVDIAAAYLAEQPGMARVLEQMAAAYRSAQVFLRATPAMPMGWLDNLETVPPIAARGVDGRVELRARLGLAESQRLVLIGFGGIAHQAAAPLPLLDGVCWLTPDDWPAGRADLISFSRAGLSFIDLVASADALVTKVGYGSFVEAAAASLPVLYIDRPDWPETPFLAAWLRDHGRAAAITESELFTPAIGDHLDQLWRLPPRPRVEPVGAAVAARRLLEILDGA